MSFPLNRPAELTGSWRAGIDWRRRATIEVEEGRWFLITTARLPGPENRQMRYRWRRATDRDLLKLARRGINIGSEP